VLRFGSSGLNAIALIDSDGFRSYRQNHFFPEGHFHLPVFFISKELPT
jgi:hypothetical protein